MHFANDFSIEEPTIVVNITTINAKVLIKSSFYPYICKHKAKAITPLTMPEYQHTFNYLLFKGKVLLIRE